MSLPTTQSSGQPAGQTPESQASPELDNDEGSASLVAEFIIFLTENRKWWLIPMVLLILILGLLIVVGATTPLGPMIYSLL